METVAVYWESRIKTYGFQRVTDVGLFEFSCPLTEIVSLGKILSQESLRTLKPPFMMAQESGDEISFVVCLPENQARDFHEFLEGTPGLTPQKYLFPVGIIFFHGPHFGDRYGIADATFTALSKAHIKVIASGCSSSSVYVVLSQDDLDRAEEVLSKPFEVAQ